jgi:hypothetical protein
MTRPRRRASALGGWTVLAILIMAGAAAFVGWEAFGSNPGTAASSASSATPSGGASPRSRSRGGMAKADRAAVLRMAHVVNHSEAENASVRTRPQRDLTDALRPRPKWTGPRPESLDQLQRTPAVQRRLKELEELEGEEWARFLDHRLRFLARLDQCIGDRISSAGGVSVTMRFRVDPVTKMATATEAFAEQSSLSEEDDEVFLACLQKTHAGSSYQKAPDYAEAEFHWSTTISVPVRDDSWYSWLQGPDAR